MIRAILLTLLAVGSIAVGSLTLAGARTHAAARAPVSESALPTVFGKGAELHLAGAWSSRTGDHAFNEAHAGTRVTAVGLGFHPGARVRIIYAMANTHFLMRPIAQSVVGPRGRFEVSFPVTPAMAHGGPWAASGLYARSIQPLLVEAYEGASPGVGPHHAYAVAALVVYSP